MPVIDSMKRKAARLAEKAWSGVQRWWESEGAPMAPGAKPGEDPLLVVKIQPERSYWAMGLISAFLLVLVLRAFWLQCGISTDFLQRQGEARFARTLAVPALRGQILDRNSIVLASTMPARSVWAVPA